MEDELMRAVAVREPGGAEVLQLVERPIPVPASGEVLVRIDAAGVNRADLLQRAGRYPPPAGVPADVPGLEYAGLVERAGAGVVRRRIGDRVMGLVGGGAYAEYVVTHEDETMIVPSSLSFDEAAAIPEAFITAHDALFTQSELCAGETVLIHAVGSGVGTAAIQLAHAIGARVIGTARSASKLEAARALGMDSGFVARDGAFAADVTSAAGARGVDVILDLVGGDYVRGDIEVLAQRGRISLVGLVAGRNATIDLGMLLRKRGTIRGTVMRARSHDEKVSAAKAFEAFALPMFEQGKLRAVVDRVFELENAADAHRYVESNANFGKVVLRI